MFRWPLALTPLSLGSLGATRDAVLEITPRGAVFTLAALTHVGHPAHLAVIDAYLKGQMRLSGSASIGEDSRLVASALAAPLVAANELGIERLRLSDLILLPPGDLTPQPSLRDGEGESLRVPESPRFLLRAAFAPDQWRWVRAAERFEVAGCTGTPDPGLGSRWHDALIQLPARPTSLTVAPPTGGLPPIDAELREPTEITLPTAALVASLRTLGQARFARAPARLRAAAHAALQEIESTGSAASPLAPPDLEREWRDAPPVATLPAACDPDALATALARPISQRQPVETEFQFRECTLGASLAPDLDGYQTLCLLPPTDMAPAALFEFMRDAAWEMIEALMGRPLAEYRTEPIALRLLGADGPTTTLDIGASVVVVRNQVVFTAWVGSDGRVMLKLFPPGGMPIP